MLNFICRSYDHLNYSLCMVILFKTDVTHRFYAVIVYIATFLTSGKPSIFKMCVKIYLHSLRSCQCVDTRGQFICEGNFIRYARVGN